MNTKKEDQSFVKKRITELEEKMKNGHKSVNDCKQGNKNNFYLHKSKSFNAIGEHKNLNWKQDVSPFYTNQHISLYQNNQECSPFINTSYKEETQMSEHTKFNVSDLLTASANQRREVYDEIIPKKVSKIPNVKETMLLKKPNILLQPEFNLKSSFAKKPNQNNAKNKNNAKNANSPLKLNSTNENDVINQNFICNPQKNTEKPAQKMIQSAIELTPPESKNCWICLSEDSPDDTTGFFRPCKCKGGTKYVHQSCFKSYLANKNRDNLKCSVCQYKYIIDYPNIKYVSIYEFFYKKYEILCSAIFISSIIVTAYMVLLLYGMIILYFFVGPDVIDDIFFINGWVNWFYCFKLLGGAPMIPLFIFFTVYAKFNVVFHLASSFFFVKGISINNLLQGIIPISFYIYFKCTDYLKKKCGRTESSQSGIMVNEYFFKATKVVNGMAMPLYGALIGQFLRFKMERVFKSLIGVVICLLLQDAFEFLYLLLMKRKISDCRVHEYIELEE